MANLISAYIYGIDGPGGSTEIAAAGGQQNLFAVNSPIHIYPTTAQRGAANVTCAAVIEAYPQGLTQPSTKYYTAASIASLLAAANAPLA